MTTTTRTSHVTTGPHLTGHESDCAAPNLVDTTQPGDYAQHAECRNCGTTWTIYSPKES